ncbi:hypothetical protein, partial [Rhodococcus pyridinivorans]
MTSVSDSPVSTSVSTSTATDLAPADIGGATESGKSFGKPIPRVEDNRLVSGNGRYLDDLGHGALAAAFVRSPHAHARILD